MTTEGSETECHCPLASGKRKLAERYELAQLERSSERYTEKKRCCACVRSWTTAQGFPKVMELFSVDMQILTWTTVHAEITDFKQPAIEASMTSSFSPFISGRTGRSFTWNLGITLIMLLHSIEQCLNFTPWEYPWFAGFIQIWQRSSQYQQPLEEHLWSRHGLPFNLYSEVEENDTKLWISNHDQHAFANTSFLILHDEETPKVIHISVQEC